ncbi:hypothetical protein H6G89_06350 [Oscillatoria sp. FACHB-1407]|uniref:hypothetical protein n=1 Tax=Oscillatoria sp. FACHB-1407 TaxID=2692847 RepID=UPI0016839C72|nr:hypothetical protein [Oscillatoria sp. FACHB-1407]MBD2460661.1 hypothetical protein [Oscillatoria sp. FACHB-1407]
MDSLNDLKIQAFSLAQLVLDTLLPDDLEQAIHQIGRTVTEEEAQAVTSIQNLVEHHGCLRKPYEVVYGDLQDHRQRLQQVNFNVQEISRSVAPPWKPVAASLLLADNPRETARLVTKKVIAQVDFREALNGLHTFWSTLMRLVQDLEFQEAAVLRSLIRHPMTVEDMSHTLGWPVEHIQAIVASLWAAGAIDVTRGHLLHRLFPVSKPESEVKKELDLGDYFTITMRGHFRLRPLVKPAEPQGVI